MKPICDICNVNDEIVYIQRRQGTFCHRCDEMVHEILTSSLDDAMKQALVDDLKHTPELMTPGCLINYITTQAPPLGATASAIGAGIQGHS